MNQSLVHHSYPGILIAFEGIDGCGKTTQIELLKHKLTQYQQKFVESKTPGGTTFGLVVRDILFSTKSNLTTHKLNGNVCSLLYLASHLQSYQEIVEPALKRGDFVISDRWDAFSGRAFATAGAVPVDPEVSKLRGMIAGPLPDITFYMKGDPQVFMDRANSGDDREHQKGKIWTNIPVLSRVQDSYDKIFEDLDGVQEIPADRYTAINLFNNFIWPWISLYMKRRFKSDLAKSL